MEIDIYEILASNGIILLFLVIGLGYFIGGLRIAGLPVGPTIGVLVTALFFGHHGLTLPSAVGSFGFTLFIFAVGLEAGPRFFSAFREDGKNYVLLALIVAVVGLALTITLGRLIGLEAGFDAGLMAGAMTSTPTLAAAQDAVRSGLATADPELAERMLENIGVGYALTYMVGTVLVILVIRYVPRMLRLNLEAMALTYAKEKGIISSRSVATTAETLPIIRAYRVGEEGHGKTLEQRRAEIGAEGVVLKIRRDGKLLEPDPRFELRKGDVVSLIASLETHRWAQEKMGGEEVLDPDLLSYQIAVHELVVLNKHVVGKTLKELDPAARFSCFAIGLVRAGVHLPITPRVVLNRGDRVVMVGEESRLRELASLIGHIEQEVEETDLVTFSLGIVVGSFVGLVTLSLAGVNLGLGSAGGLLLAGLAVGYLSSVNPTFGRVPGAARYLLKELGLMLLMASIGLNAGGGIVEGLVAVGPTIILCAVLVSTIPIGVGYLVGRKMLRMNPVLLLGALTGAMTSTPALAMVTDAAKSNVPAIGYAGTYTFANVALTFAGTFLMTA